jgi:transposase
MMLTFAPFHPSPYSPDLNPIEQLWSKLKAYLCTVKARSGIAFRLAFPDSFFLI